MASKMPELVAMMFEVRTQAHKFHLQTRSYEVHIALGGYYDSILDIADSIAEDWQGREGIIEVYPKPIINTSNPIKMIETFRSWLDANKEACSPYREHQNIIDAIQSLNNSTIYKLRNLK